MTQSIGPALRHYWQWLSPHPGGRWLFSRLLGRTVRYTGSIGADIQSLEPGYCAVTLRDRRNIRNHLRSIHAIALCNLGEMVTGLALLNSLPDKTRGILTEIRIEYLKKARDTLSAECRCDIPVSNAQQEIELSTEIRDLQGDIVAITHARWLIGPEK